MANEDHVVQIGRGVKVWNAWREKNPDLVPDLIRADLSGADLSHANFRGANLWKANLSSADLSHAELSNADLWGANLWKANLWKANLSSADLSHADLNDANLWKADLLNANLSDATFRGADLSHADLFRANLRNADLRCAKLSSADLRWADLRCANLWKANLNDAHLRSADLSQADLFRANLRNADLSHANLNNVNLVDADLQQARFIDTCLDDATLTGVKLWETQRGGWSIKRITCQWAFWDRNGNESTEYEDGDFERIFAEKPRIVLRYPGGMSPVDLAMLPLIIERLQTKHPDCALHIRSVQDDGSGATVTITVKDLADRSDEAFAHDIEALRGDLVMVQQRLQQEERLRLAFEAKYSAVVRDILPMMIERALLRTEVNVGQLTAPMIIEGNTMSGDTYNTGQAGAVGKNAHAHDMSFQQAWNQSNIDLPRLAEELTQLRAAMKQEPGGTREQDKAIGAVADAEEAAINGNGPTTLQHLKAAGKWALGIAEKIGVTVATEAIKRAM